MLVRLKLIMLIFTSHVCTGLVIDLKAQWLITLVYYYRLIVLALQGYHAVFYEVFTVH